MLDKKVFGVGILKMNAVCHQQMKTEDTMEVYYAALKDNISNEEYIQAIEQLILTKTNVYTPFSIAEILNAGIDIRYKDKLSPAEWMKLEIIKHGGRSFPKEISDLINQIGGIDKIEENKSLINLRIKHLDGLNQLESRTIPTLCSKDTKNS